MSDNTAIILMLIIMAWAIFGLLLYVVSLKNLLFVVTMRHSQVLDRHETVHRAFAEALGIEFYDCEDDPEHNVCFRSPKDYIAYFTATAVRDAKPVTDNTSQNRETANAY